MKLNPSYVNVPQQSWNSSFHNLITDCNLSSYFPPSTLPECYRKGESHGHVLHVDLSKLVTNTFYLTMMESNRNLLPSHYSDSAPLFIHSTIFHNPVWDLGLQFMLARKNADKIYTLDMKCLNMYSLVCVCPCSRLLSKWHHKYMFNKMPIFGQCGDNVFQNPIDFVNHLHSMSEDYYHRIIMRMVQGLYSPLLSKLKTKQNSSCKEYKKGFSSFASVHKEIVTLPAQVTSNSHYNLFRFKR